ncbi:MAG: FkbM family methyltransferase [Rhodospirillaceae bacterium]
MLSQQLLEIASNLAPNVPTWPRRKPGLFMAGHRVIRYADLHSFYHQTRQIFGQRLYNFRASSAAPVILDCGAHIGLASLFFKERFPAARITAFEADAALADICRQNFAAFDAADIEVVAAAVWTHADGVGFAQSNDDAGHIAGAEDATAVRVPSVRLRSYLDRPVDLLKLDVEGAEFDLIEDCADMLKNVRNIVMEVHAMGDAPAPMGRMLARLEDLGLRYVLGDLHQATWIPAGTTPPFEHCRTEKYILTVFAWRP